MRRTRPVLLLVTGVLLVAAGTWALGFSDLLAVRNVEVSGLTAGSVLSPTDVERAANAPLGEPLARIDLGPIEDRVGKLPAVASVTVGRSWPRTISIDVAERHPVAVWRDGSVLRLVDKGGNAFGVADPDLPAHRRLIPLQVADIDAELRASGAAVAAALPRGLSARVTRIEVDSPDGVRLRLDGGALVRWGSAGQSAEKVEVLGALLETDARVYDVSVPRRPALLEP